MLLYKPILKMLDDRAKKVEEADKAAQETLREKEEMDALKKKSKVQADRDAAKLLEKAREQAAELKNELAKKAKDELHQEHEKALSVWKGIEIEEYHTEIGMRIKFPSQDPNRAYLNTKDSPSLLPILASNDVASRYFPHVQLVQDFL